MFVFFSIFLFLSVFLEGVWVTVPLPLLFLVCFFILWKDQRVFLLGFIAGILLDSMMLRQIGETSLFYSICLFLILLYQRKYEIGTFPFVLFSSFFASLAYGMVFHNQMILFVAIFSTIIATGIFLCIAHIKGMSTRRKDAKKLSQYQKV